jgi:hypothetical protein
MAFISVFPAATFAQNAADGSPSAWSPSLTSWGDPNLEGIYTNVDEFGVPLEQPERFRGHSLADVTPSDLADFAREFNERRRANPEYLAFGGLNAVVGDAHPSRPWLVVDPADGRIPPLTAAGRQRQADYQASLNAPPDNAASLNLWNRCISIGLLRSMMPSQDGAPYRIVQAPGVVAIAYERMHEARVIPLDGRPHVAGAIRGYMGDARGRWESGSLVVETTHFQGRFQLTSAASDALRVIERFTPTGPNTLEWSVTLDDASGWVRPWTFSMPLSRTKAQLFEDACHEGNHTVRNILSGARASER